MPMLKKTLDARKAEVDSLTAQLSGAEAEGMNASSERLRASLELDRLTAAVAQHEANIPAVWPPKLRPSRLP